MLIVKKTHLEQSPIAQNGDSTSFFQLEVNTQLKLTGDRLSVIISARLKSPLPDGADGGVVKLSARNRLVDGW